MMPRAPKAHKNTSNDTNPGINSGNHLLIWVITLPSSTSNSLKCPSRTWRIFNKWTKASSKASSYT